MAKYLLIESRDPFDSADSEYFSDLVEGISSSRKVRMAKWVYGVR
jgi:hypothetical protein